VTGASGRRAGRRSGLPWKGLVGIVLSVSLLWYAFRDIHLSEILHEVRGADPWLLGLSAVLVTVPFFFRALRWGPILAPIHAGARLRSLFACTCIGFMANNLLPARVGEFARAYALTRLEPIRLSASFGSLVVERMFDAVMVIGLLLVALAWPGFPDIAGRGYGRIGLLLGLLLTLGFTVLLFLVSRPQRAAAIIEAIAARALPGRLRRRVVDALVAFLTGAAVLRDGRLVLRALAWSVAVWLTAGLATWVAFLAFDIDAPFIAAVFLQSIIALAVSLPSGPGFFGLFEAAARVGLVDVWGIETSQAMAFAIGFHLAGYFPVTFIGLYYVWRLDFSWREVEESEEIVETAVELGGPLDQPGGGTSPDR
jgi:glycosyltransferase 2 family protein